MNGILLIDKPVGLTSHDIVEVVRRFFGFKVGHTGTLDPFATGLLVLLIGDATKLSSYLVSGKKTYTATMQFGIETDTWDITGKILRKNNYYVFQKDIEAVFTNLTGEIELEIPLYSAKKIKGKKLYEYARKGLEIDIPTTKNVIYRLSLLCFSYPYLTFEVECSHGTYIRSLAYKISKKLDTVATLCSLRRIKNGCFKIEDAICLDSLSKGYVLGIEQLVQNRLNIYPSSMKKVVNGNVLLADKDISDIKKEDELLESLYKVDIGNVIYIYKKENDIFKYVLKVDNTNEDL